MTMTNMSGEPAPAPPAPPAQPPAPTSAPVASIPAPPAPPAVAPLQTPRPSHTFTGFGTFLGKELRQTLRTARLWIIVGVFVLLGAINAPLTWGMPLLMESLSSSSGQSLEQMGALLPEPSALETWAQYFGNVAQMGILTILLVCGSTLSSERKHGTLILPLTKGLGRTSVVLAKFINASVLWTCGIVLSAGVSALLTFAFFPGDSMPNPLLALAALWLFGEFLLALIPLSSLITKGSFAGLILPGGLLMVLLIFAAFPTVFTFNPLLLGSMGVAVMYELAPASNLLLPCVIAVCTSVAALVAAAVLFRRSSV